MTFPDNWGIFFCFLQYITQYNWSCLIWRETCPQDFMNYSMFQIIKPTYKTDFLYCSFCLRFYFLCLFIYFQAESKSKAVEEAESDGADSSKEGQEEEEEEEGTD